MSCNTVPEGTPQEHVQAVKDGIALVLKEGQVPGIRNLYVDDWGRFSNFSLMLYPETTPCFKGNQPSKKLANPQVTRAAMAKLGKAMKSLGYRVQTRVAMSFSESQRMVNIDLDFNHYDRETNSFHPV